jgi:hypothetical protein
VEELFCDTAGWDWGGSPRGVALVGRKLGGEEFRCFGPRR